MPSIASSCSSVIAATWSSDSIPAPGSTRRRLAGNRSKITSCSSRVTYVPSNATILLGSVVGGAGTPGARASFGTGADSPSSIGTIRHSMPSPGSLIAVPLMAAIALS